jgi:nucleoside-diphosphate-sugar epimerase
LLEKGYEIHGIIRRVSIFSTQRINHLYQAPHVNGVKMFLHYGGIYIRTLREGTGSSPEGKHSVLSAFSTVPLFGSGTPLREFLHVDDLAAACLFMLQMEIPPDLANVGSGVEVTIRELAEKVKAATGCPAEISWDSSKPDGTPRKLCDTSLIRSLGWSPKIDLDTGLAHTIEEYRKAIADGTARL